MSERGEIRIGEVLLSLDEAEETLRAIRAGTVDAVVVEGSEGERVFTFRDPGHPYRILVEAMSQGAVLTTPDGTVCYCNPFFASLVGASAASLNGQPFAELVVAEQRARVEELFARAHAAPFARDEVGLLAPQGVVPVQLSASRAAIADVPVLAVVVTDLAEHRRQEELYRAARLELQGRDRLVSIAAHELRGPLGVIELQTQSLASLIRNAAADQALATERTLAVLERLREQGRRLAALVGKLLDVGSLGAGRLQLARERMDLGQAARAVVERCHPAIERSGSPLMLDLATVWGEWDRVRVEQVIENLLTNAAKYGMGKPIRMFVDSDGRRARIGVEDAGRGIPVEARERIFRPYERVLGEDGVPGMGLGLYIAAEIVRAHGGAISVEGREGGGSRFVVELPLAEVT